MKVLAILGFLGLATSGFAQSVCQTPNGENARCLPLNQCAPFKPFLVPNSKPSREVIRFFQESKCGYANGHWVCCGSVAGYQSLESITARPPPKRPTPSPPRIPPNNNRPSQIQTSPDADPRSHRNFNLLPSGNNCGVQGSDNRILGGEETQLDEFPWMTLIEYRQNGRSTGHGCGGMLISRRYVLTAAHCVTGAIIPALGNPFRVRVGEHNTKTPRDCQLLKEGDEEYEECSEYEDIGVEEVIPHPSYNLDGQEFNDIALIRLARPAVLNDYVQAVCLPVNGERSAVGQSLSVAGWGRTETRAASDVKLKVQVPVVSFQECSNKYASQRRQLSDQQFCAGALQGIDSCRGDSGGPIMTKFPGVTPTRWYVEGVVSYGPDPCGIRGWPGVYTRVSSYVNWILDNMKP